MVPSVLTRREALMNGRLSEDLIIAKIEQKCDIKRDPTYDHVYKLDFIVDRFKSIAKQIPIGVQVTTKLNDYFKQTEFLKERKKKTLVDKSIYVEVDPKVDISNWGSELIYSALVAFTFMKDLATKHISGVRIYPDIIYEFFDIEENIKKNQVATKNTLTGKIVRYNPKKGFGFIETNENEKWFFHISSISDKKLKESFLDKAQINPEDNTLAKPIYVNFEDGGLPKGASAPSAINIKLSLARK